MSSGRWMNDSADPVDAGIERGFEIGTVLRRQRRERDRGVGQAHALAVRQFAADLDARDDAVLLDRVSRTLPSSSSSVWPGSMAAKISGCGRCTRVASPGAGSASSTKTSPWHEGDGVVREAADAQLRALQIDQDADRPPVLELDRADRRHQLAHALVRGVAHVDAEDVGAGREQPLDDRAVGGGRTERGDDLGPAQASHRRRCQSSGRGRKAVRSAAPAPAAGPADCPAAAGAAAPARSIR